MIRILHDDGAIFVTAIGRGWLRVPRAAWDAFIADVKLGDYDAAGVPGIRRSPAAPDGR